jgi:hypothetical protein
MTDAPLAATKDPTGFGHVTGGGPETTPGGEGGTAGYAQPRAAITGGSLGTQQTVEGLSGTGASGAAERSRGSATSGGNNGPGTTGH